MHSAQCQRLLVRKGFVTYGAELSAKNVAAVKRSLRSRRGILSGCGPRRKESSLDVRDRAPGLG